MPPTAHVVDWQSISHLPNSNTGFDATAVFSSPVLRRRVGTGGCIVIPSTAVRRRLACRQIHTCQYVRRALGRQTLDRNLQAFPHGIRLYKFHPVRTLFRRGGN